MPLAVQRLSAGALPAEVTLDESMAMMPQFNLSTFDPIVIGARISSPVTHKHPRAICGF